MRNILRYAIVLFIIIAFFTLGAYADDNPIRKLGRGLCNVVTSPLEITNGIQVVNNEDGAFAALTLGVIQGIFKMGVRAVVGVYEIATFPIPIPKGFKPILTNPEFFYEGGFLHEGEI